MQEEPAVEDILKAVAAQLESSVLPMLPRDAAFHTKLAVNAIRLVERQLRRMPAAALAEDERLRELLNVSGDISSGDLNAALVSRIEAGAFDTNPGALTAHLWATTLDQLSIDQPRYGNYLKTRSSDQEGESD